MGSVKFYHMTQTPLEGTLAQLLAKSLDIGLRVELRGRDEQRLDWLDRQLWLGDPAGFVPHGRAGGAHDALQPILLTTTAGALVGATCIVSIDGATIDPEEVQALDRAMILFDGQDGAAVSTARGQWKALTDAGCAAEYWAQENGKWTLKTERKAE